MRKGGPKGEKTGIEGESALISGCLAGDREKLSNHLGKEGSDSEGGGEGGGGGVGGMQRRRGC